MKYIEQVEAQNYRKNRNDIPSTELQKESRVLY